MKTSRDLAQIRTFCLQVNPEHWRALLEAYIDATEAGHSYLLWDFKPNQKDHLRLRTHIFPDERTIIYIPNKTYNSSYSGLIYSVPYDASSSAHAPGHAESAPLRETAHTESHSERSR